MKQSEKIDLILEQQTNANSDITYIKSLLEDNPKTGQKGAIKRINELEVKVDNIETKDAVRVGKATVIGGFIGGVIVPGLWWVGKLAIKFLF